LSSHDYYTEIFIILMVNNMDIFNLNLNIIQLFLFYTEGDHLIGQSQ